MLDRKYKVINDILVNENGDEVSEEEFEREFEKEMDITSFIKERVNEIFMPVIKEKEKQVEVLNKKTEQLDRKIEALDKEIKDFRKGYITKREFNTVLYILYALMGVSVSVIGSLIGFLMTRI